LPPGKHWSHRMHMHIFRSRFLTKLIWRARCIFIIFL
jgi:hypothetical protein